MLDIQIREVKFGESPTVFAYRTDAEYTMCFINRWHGLVVHPVKRHDGYSLALSVGSENDLKITGIF